jgi:2-polyprenyl-3-methyl-5-hydroxy-6-metoxy-1,4-benzoquinol methylase
MEKETSVTHPQQNEYAYMEEINEGVLRNLPPRQESGEGRFVLDVGCGYGALAEAIENKGYAVWGIERHDVASALAGQRMTKVIHEDLTNLGAVREAIGERRFEYLVFSDVLEHLHDPDLILRSYLPFLKDSGTVIVSVPNVAAWNIRLRLLLGIFKYADSGILDRTHLRFFTFKTAQKMLRDAGLRVTKKDLTPYLMRSFLPIIKKVFLRSGKGRVDSRRAIIVTTPYGFYLRWIYPLEYVEGRILNHCSPSGSSSSVGKMGKSKIFFVRERARPVRNFSGRALVARTLVDLRLASIYYSIRRELSNATGSVLEVGFGNTPYRFLIKHASYTGINHAEAAELSCQREGVVYYRGDAFPVKDESFDLVFHKELLEQVENPNVFIRNYWSGLRPCGRMFFSVPFSYRYHYIPYDYYRYTPSSLKSLCERAGFSDVAIRPQGTDNMVACHKVISVFMAREKRSFFSRLLGILFGLIFLPLLVLVHLADWLSLVFDIGPGNDTLGYFVKGKK